MNAVKKYTNTICSSHGKSLILGERETFSSSSAFLRLADDDDRSVMDSFMSIQFAIVFENFQAFEAHKTSFLPMTSM